MDKIRLAKYCINCKYSVLCNDRLLCIKHGCTTENDDYCHDLYEREIIVIQDMPNDFMYSDTDSVKSDYKFAKENLSSAYGLMKRPKVRGIRARLRVFYYKWIKGNCRHFCRFCKYTNDCLDEIDDIANRSGRF